MLLNLGNEVFMHSKSPCRHKVYFNSTYHSCSNVTSGSQSTSEESCIACTEPASDVLLAVSHLGKLLQCPQKSLALWPAVSCLLLVFGRSFLCQLDQLQKTPTVEASKERCYLDAPPTCWQIHLQGSPHMHITALLLVQKMEPVTILCCPGNPLVDIVGVWHTFNQAITQKGPNVRTSLSFSATMSREGLGRPALAASRFLEFILIS